MAITLAGIVLAPENQFQSRLEWRGGATVLANGNIRRDLVQASPKHVFTLSWPWLTATDRANLESAYEAAVNGPVSFVAPDGETYTVTAAEEAALEFDAFRSAGRLIYRTSAIVLREV